MNSKEQFFEYIGSDNSLSGYVRSYKIVFLLCFFNMVDKAGRVKTIDLARDFKKFYENRKNKGLIPDQDVEPRIANIERSTVYQVLSVIKDNPYRVVNQKEFLSIQQFENEEYFCLKKDLFDSFGISDFENIKRILAKKLDLYYSRIDNEVENMNNTESFKKLLEDFMKNYVSVRTTTAFGKNSVGMILTDKIPNLITQLESFNPINFSVKGSYGNGNWTHTPWIAVFNKRITQTVQEGVYIVYLFSSDMERVYLTLNQGCTKLKATFGTKETLKKMQALAELIRGKIEAKGFFTDNNLNIGHELYEQGTIFYKAYKKDNIPADNILYSDLVTMMDVYDEYYQSFITQNKESLSEMEEIKTMNTVNNEFNVKDELKRISSYIRSKGFTFEDDLITNYYLSLKSKPFVILAGISGTGKSKLVRLFAESIGATSENGKFKLIPVRPDWSDSSDLLGYRDLNGNFHPGILTNVIVKAKKNPDEPFFICLDEMNLARVEYYLSDILSVMESRRRLLDKLVSDSLLSEECIGHDSLEQLNLQDLSLPDNVYIIGTVNMDETTFPFSKKVLDRANTIEFSYVNLEPQVIKIVEQHPELLHNNFLKSSFLLLEDCIEYEEKINETISILKEINYVLQTANLHFGYRVRDEICFYVIYNYQNDLMSFNQAIDNVILQKILPKIQGSNSTIKRVLIELFKICINNSAQLFSYEASGICEEMLKYLKTSSGILYKKTAEKIAFMMRRFEEDGFTSYWL